MWRRYPDEANDGEVVEEPKMLFLNGSFGEEKEPGDGHGRRQASAAFSIPGKLP